MDTLLVIVSDQEVLGFFCSSHTTRVIVSDRVIYFEDDTSISQGPREIVFKEHLVFIPVPIAFLLSLALLLIIIH